MRVQSPRAVILLVRYWLCNRSVTAGGAHSCDKKLREGGDAWHTSGVWKQRLKQERQHRAMSDAVDNIGECARAIESALVAMDPPLEVFGGVLKLIAEFAQPRRK